MFEYNYEKSNQPSVLLSCQECPEYIVVLQAGYLKNLAGKDHFYSFC